MKQKLVELLQDKDFIQAVWEGGSAATGFLDEYSDLDLMIIADDDKIESVFLLIDDFLLTNYGIERKFRVPEPCWHGMSQCYYILEKSPEFFFFDMAVQKLSAEEKFMEKDRHGDAQVWFDKKNIINSEPTPEDVVVKKGSRAFKNVTNSFFLMPIDVKKQVLRGRFVDALESYFRGCFGRLSVLLNLKYRPEKFDFNLRYSYRVYPHDVNEKLKDLMLVKNEEDLLKKIDILETWFYQLQLELEEQWDN